MKDCCKGEHADNEACSHEHSKSEHGEHKHVASKIEHDTVKNKSEYVRIRKKDIKNIMLIGIIAFLFVFAVAQTINVAEMKTGKDITIFGFGAESPNTYASSAPRASSSGMVGGC